MKPDTVHTLKGPMFGWVQGIRREQCIFEDLSMDLPLEASLAGMTLTFELPMVGADPVYLKDKDGNVLFEWDKPPSLTEVREVALRWWGLTCQV